MKRIYFNRFCWLFFLIFMFLFRQTVCCAHSTSSNHVKVHAQSFKNEGIEYLVIIFNNDTGWHTYWKNPGTAGLPIKVSFYFQGETIPIDSIEWPAPSKFREKGNVFAYGYDGSYALYFPLTEEHLRIFAAETLTIKLNWLVCKEVCIPEKDVITGHFKHRQFISDKKVEISWKRKRLKAYLQAIPSLAVFPANFDIYLSLSEDKKTLNLFYRLAKQDVEYFSNIDLLLVPFPHQDFSFREELLYLDKNNEIYGKIPVIWEGQFKKPKVLLPSDGHFTRKYNLKFLYYDFKKQKVFVINKEFDSFDISDASISAEFVKTLTPLHKVNKIGQIDRPSRGILLFLFLAFLGGLILNVMPCVLPVISLKLFELIKRRDQSRRQIFLHNLFYTLGVLVTFFILASVVVLLKKGGEEVGWGFQLQSPKFVGLMIIILFVFALNLLGLFEFKTIGGRYLANIKLHNGYWSDILSGMIATVLSTPCSAPFLGTALLFAFTSSFFNIYLIFIMIGLGLAFPFIMIGVIPSLISFLPRPGKWMIYIKMIMALLLLLTMAWLFYIFKALTVQMFPISLLIMNLIMVFTAFYVLGKILPKTVKVLFCIIEISLIVCFLVLDIQVYSKTRASEIGEKNIISKSMSWERWSPEKLRNNQDIIFMDFTAKWCFTCIVNERFVINTTDFRQLIKKHNIRLLLADWTNRDETIGQWLKQHGYVGVPAYFIQGPDGKIFALGETISIDEIEQTIHKIKSY